MIIADMWDADDEHIGLITFESREMLDYFMRTIDPVEPISFDVFDYEEQEMLH